MNKSLLAIMLLFSIALTGYAHSGLLHKKYQSNALTYSFIGENEWTDDDK